MRSLVLLLTVFLMVVGGVPIDAAAGQRLRQYFIDYYTNIHDENGTRVVLKSRKIDIVTEIEDPVVRNIAKNIIKQLIDQGVTNIEISEDRDSANLFVKSTAKIKEELRKNKKFFQKYFDTPDELDAKAASISDTLGCDIAMRTGIQPVTARILIARLAVTRRYNNAYVLFDRLASIPAKLKCLKIGILIAFGFLPNPNSSVPSVFQGNEMSLKFSDEDLDAMKFLNSDAVKDVQLFETLLEQLD